MEAILLQRENRHDTPQSDLEAWTASFRSACGRYSLELVEANAFAGWVRPISGSGFAAVEVAGRVNRVERTHRDTRLDGVDQYAAVFQIAGQSTMSQNGQVVQLAAGPTGYIHLRWQERAMAQPSATAQVADFPSRIRAARWGFWTWRTACRAPAL
jgi:hypothetical protein